MPDSTRPDSSPRKQGATPQTLQIIRLAMLGGVVLFGLLAWFFSRNAELGDLDAEMFSIMRTMYVVLLVGAGIGLFVLRTRVRQGVPFEKRASLLIMGYALAEAPALFGAVLLLLSGSALPFLVGVLLVLLAFLVLPLPSDVEE